MTELNTEYWVLRSNAGDTFELQTTVGNSLDTSGYGAAETTGGNCAQLCTANSWTAGTGFHPAVDGSGVLVESISCDGSQVADSDLTQNVITAAGLVKVSFTVANYSAGNICGLADTEEGTDVAANGSYEQLIWADSAGVAGVRADADFVGSVDDISVEPFTNCAMVNGELDPDMRENGVLPHVESEATGSQAMAVIGVLPAITCEAAGMQLVHCSLDATLPAIKCEAYISAHGDLDAKLPTISCEAQCGSYVDGKLPTIKCEGEIGSVIVGRLDGVLPGIRCEAYCGARLDKRIPTVSCEGEITFPVLGWLDKDIPGITCEGAISGGAGAWLDKDIPVIRCEGIISCSPIIYLDETLPGIRGLATGRWCGAALDARIPAVRSDEDDTISETLVHCTLDAKIPAVIMAGEGYGGDGDSGGSISYKSRFTDYILRYNRWA